MDSFPESDLSQNTIRKGIIAAHISNVIIINGAYAGDIAGQLRSLRLDNREAAGHYLYFDSLKVDGN